MACGQPSVLSNEGFRETLGAYAEELMFPHGDAAVLADRLHRVQVHTQAQRASMEAHLRQRVVELRGLDAVMARLAAVLRMVSGRDDAMDRLAVEGRSKPS